MKYAVIKKHDVANGLGVRVSLFVSGCTHHCKGCFNQIAWDFGYGSDFTEKTVQELLEALRPDYIKGLSLLGGEPFELVNQKVLLPFLQKVKEFYPSKDIWAYSGYVFEDLSSVSLTREMLSYIDVLVDGKFQEELKDYRLLFRGSSNQRIIDVKKSLEQHCVVIHPIQRDEVFIESKSVLVNS